MNESSIDPHPEESNAWVDRLDALCDRFEQQWIKGEEPVIEQYLADLSEPERHSLFEELLHVELEYKWNHNRTCRRQDYLTRIPEYASTIETSQFQPPTVRKAPDDNEAYSERDADPNAETVVFTTIEGHKLANFELLQQSGKGKFGVVWKARDTQLDRFVAIKLPRKEQLDQSDIDQFLREARSAARLNHENIVRVYEVSQEDESVYIVSEFIDGLTLKERLQCGPLTFRETAELCAKLARALHHAHSNGVIHRDLKPGNVLLDREGEPHITDFGLAKREAGDATISVDGMILGTPYYMSPEQAAGKGALVDRRSDIFALGVMLYEMLTEERPFQGEIKVVLHQVQHVEPRAPRKLKSTVPCDLETICLKAMAKEPARRYATAEDFAADLGHYLRGEPIRARRISRVERAWIWMRRNPATAGSSIATIIAMSLALAILAGAFGRIMPEPAKRRVYIVTEPPGATIALYPLDVSTGEPLVSEKLVFREMTPFVARLAPGDYLLIAAIDGFGFHEVYRHVPLPDESLAEHPRNRYWHLREDGGLEWVPVEVFPYSITTDMARIDGTSRFEMGTNVGVPSKSMTRHFRAVPTFYIDPTECTIGAYKRVNQGVPPPHYPEQRTAPDDHAVSYISYDEAVSIAERLGKRLPDETEFEFAATARGRFRFPWGDRFPTYQSKPIGFGPVGIPGFDRLEVTPPVLNLCTNVAEWTTSWALPYSANLRAAFDPSLADSRIVRGTGDGIAVVEGEPQMTEFACDPRHRLKYSKKQWKAGLGLRCVRSAKPRLHADDFVTVVLPPKD